jgi:antirestriction protein ArdC
MAQDIHAIVTDQIVAAIEAGAKSGGAAWLTLSGMPQRVTGDEYRGINSLILGLTAYATGYSNPTWLTFNQAKALGGMVRKGEKATRVVFYKMLEREAEGEDEPTRGIPMLRQYAVFNVDQIDGLGDRFAVPTLASLPAKQRNDAAEAALRSTGATISESGGNRAFYRRSEDAIFLPRFELFRTTELYLATLAHELVHWTGAEHRLDREKGKAFGDAAYAFEELVAEIGAAFVCARLGLSSDHINDHADYVGSWLKAMRGDKKLIFKAAALAQTAADLVLANAGNADRVGAPTAAHTARPAGAPLQLGLAL